jgi:hypothetical protein
MMSQEEVGIQVTEESLIPFASNDDDDDDEDDLDEEYDLSNDKMEVDMIIDMLQSPIKELDEHKVFFECIQFINKRNPEFLKETNDKLS